MKYRVRTKGAKKGVRWGRGQSSSSNPEKTRHRDAARTRAALMGTSASGAASSGQPFSTLEALPSKLTAESLLKHDALLAKGPGAAGGGAESDVVSLGQTHKTFETFASDWTNCENASFDRLIKKFNPSNPRQMQMLVVLGALTDVIRERKGETNNTEYFAALLTTLESASKEEEELDPVIGLLAMVVKSVPREVLQAQFSDVSKLLFDRLKALLAEGAGGEHGALMCRNLIGCVSVVLRAQSLFTWSQGSTKQMYRSVLELTVHPRPKVRRAAQHAVCAVLRGSFLMATEDAPAFHPVAAVTASDCLDRLRRPEPEASVNEKLHTLVLLKEVLPCVPEKLVKSVCEVALGLVQDRAHPYVSVCGMQMLHSLFAARPAAATLSAALNGQLVNALYELRPSVNDPQPTVTWLTVLQEALINFAHLDPAPCLAHVVKFFGEAKKGWASDRKEVAAATTTALRALLRECVGPHVGEFAKSGKRKLEELFAHVMDGLGYQYHSSWGQVLCLVAELFTLSGPACAFELCRFLPLLADRRAGENFPFVGELDYAVGAAVRAFGPRAVLEKVPLGVTGREGEALDFPRSWLLPVLRENVQRTELAFFTEHFLPLTKSLREAANRCLSKDDAVGRKIYSLLEVQVWALLPGFCNAPTDLKAAFTPTLARELGETLGARQDTVRGHVLAGLRQLVSKCDVGEGGSEGGGREVMANRAKNYLPILCNIYTSEPSGTEEANQRSAVLTTIREYARVAQDVQVKEGGGKVHLLHHLFDRAFHEVYPEAVQKQRGFVKEATLDIFKAYLPYQDPGRLRTLYDFAVANLGAKDHTMQKKSYRILEELCRSESQGCLDFVQGLVKEEGAGSLQAVLLKSLSKASPASQAPRLKCLMYVVNRLAREDQSPGNSKFVKTIIPEAVLCIRAVNANARQTAVELIKSIGEAMVNWSDDGTVFNEEEEEDSEEDEQMGEDAPKRNSARDAAVTDFVTTLSGGLAGDPTMIHCTLLALATVVFEFRDAVPDAVMDTLVGNVVRLMTCSSREVVGSCLSFVKVFVQVNPVFKTGRNLRQLVGGLVGMTDDCQRHQRQKTRDVLERLFRKFGYDDLVALVPKDNEVMHKRLRNIQKEHARKLRNKELRKRNEEEEEDDGGDFKVGVKARTMDEILDEEGGSDSEMEEDAAERRDARSRKKKRQTFIVEGGEQGAIVDFLDPSAAQRVTSVKPQAGGAGQKGEASKKGMKDKNGGFEMTSDGRLLIKESDSEDEEDGPGGDDDDEEDDDNTFKALVSASRKRKLGGSVASGASTVRSRASKYQAGGSGIHRPLGGSKDGNKRSASSGDYGAEFRAPKAGGDVKRKGQPDPYAYVPLQKSSLNKRKRQKFEGQFKNLVHSAKQGAAAGSKAKGKRAKQNVTANMRHLSI